MRPSDLRARLAAGLLDFAWDEWGQMGIPASARRTSSWAQDPEALVVFTLELARDDPRLFDELLDWLATNEDLVSVWRLRAMCGSSADRRLVDAAVDWVALTSGRGGRSRTSETSDSPEPELLFRGLSANVADPDPAFARMGLLRPRAQPAGTARRPDVRRPVNFAFRLRQLLGVSARAEVVRLLLTDEAEAVTGRSIARAAGFAGRNVREALQGLSDSGVVVPLGGARDQRYAIDRGGWMRLLEVEPGELPARRDWPQVLGALRDLLRWLSDPELDGLSDYLLGSQAVALLDDLGEGLRTAGVRVDRATADTAWLEVERVSARAVDLLGAPRDSAG